MCSSSQAGGSLELMGSPPSKVCRSAEYIARDGDGLISSSLKNILKGDIKVQGPNIWRSVEIRILSINIIQTFNTLS